MSEFIECLVTAGTHVSENAPATRYFNVSKSGMVVSNNGSGDKFYSYFHNALPSDLDERRVVSAKMRIRSKTHAGSPTLRLHRHAKPATSYTAMTWNNRAVGITGMIEYTVTQVGTNQYWEFDVLADVLAIQAGAPYYGWALTTTNVTDRWGIYGWQTDDAPVLTIEFDDVPLTPTDIEPHGAVAVTKPMFHWSAPPDLVSAQIQIAATTDPDFAAPLFDSGAHATTVGQLDTNTLGYAGITSSGSVLVRIRQSNSEVTSDWSDVITVTHTPLGTVNITSPGGTTTDPTPTVVWAFTGTQARWQVVTLRNGLVIADTGVVAGTDTAYQPAVGATASGQVLTYRVRVWDSVARSPSPGDPGYAEDSQASTYTPGTVTALTTLVATQDGEAPWVDLTWTRAAGVADKWVVTRNGDIIAVLAGTDGGSPVWSYRDWTCPPNTDVTYRVFPQTGTTVGSTGPTVAFRSVVTGAWVFDPDTEEFFSITGHQNNPAYAESSIRYDPIGATEPVKRTWALRGLEGDMSGLLDDFDGRTVAEQMVDLLAIKGRPDTVVRLAWLDINIPVTLTRLSPVPSIDSSDTDKIRKDVSFTFDQAGELPFPEVAP